MIFIKFKIKHTAIALISFCIIFSSCTNTNSDLESQLENEKNLSTASATTTVTESLADFEETSNKINSENSDTNETLEYKQPVITDKSEEISQENKDNEVDIVEKTEADILEHILPYYKQNNDTIGYIKITDTPIDYPVLQYDDNYYYLHNDINNEKSSKGSIFLDYKCDFQDFSATRNNILYGHRMKDGTMFKGLIKYFDEDFYNKHRTITFDTLYGRYQWEVFSVFETHIRFNYINTDFPDDEVWLEFLNVCKEKSIYKNDIELTADDILLTLSTCSTDDMYRCVIMARLTSQSNDDESTLIGDILIPDDENLYIEEDE